MFARCVPVLFAVLGAALPAGAEVCLQVHNRSDRVLAVTRTVDPWVPGPQLVPPGQGGFRRLLRPGESASFSYRLGGKDLEGELTVRNLAENGLVHYEGVTVQVVRPGRSWPAQVGAASLLEPLPAASEEEAGED